MRYFIRLSYDGSAFCGWQIQENANSVQEELQNALTTLLKEPVSITGAGRTDSGVNAINYIAHFDTCLLKMPPDNYLKQNPIQNVGYLVYKINAILPAQICVHEIFSVPNNLHARFDAISRTYKYFIHTTKDPFHSKFSFYISPNKIDINKMNQAAQFFIGEHDFSSLEKVNGGNKTSICNVSEAYWSPIKDDFTITKDGKDTRYVFTVTANRFLRNMVRAMVGSLLEVGSGKRPVEWIATMLEEKNRSSAGSSVPGNALFLYNISYLNNF